MKESVRFEVAPHPPYSPDEASFDFWLLGALKKHLERIHFTCEEEVVTRIIWRILHRRVRKTYTALEALYRTRRKLCGKMRNRSKVHSLSYTFYVCFLSIPCLDVCGKMRNRSKVHSLSYIIYVCFLSIPCLDVCGKMRNRSKVHSLSYIFYVCFLSIPCLDVCGKMRNRSKVHSLSYFLRVFLVDTLSGCKDTNTGTLLPERPTYSDH